MLSGGGIILDLRSQCTIDPNPALTTSKPIPVTTLGSDFYGGVFVSSSRFSRLDWLNDEIHSMV